MKIDFLLQGTENTWSLSKMSVNKEQSNGKKRWTEEHTRIALYLYFQLPFGKLHKGNPDIIALAKLIDKTPSSLAMKLSNFASLDPKITDTGRKGLTGATKLDRQIWSEFESDWTEQISLIEEMLENEFKNGNRVRETRDPFRMPDYKGKTQAEALIKLRVGQDFFRRAVLANFNERCCVTGIAEPKLLNASHIVPWAEGKNLRHNPANGLALSATFDRAFDTGLIGFDEKTRLVLSNTLKNHDDETTRNFFGSFSGKKIRDSIRFDPCPDFLKWHMEHVFLHTG